jgi:hypothetical protein
LPTLRSERIGVVAVASVLEWIQCKTCGRRHRWKAELVGTDLACSCGAKVPVPSVDPGATGSGAFDPEDTLVDPSLTNEAAAISDAPAKRGDDLEIEEAPARSKAGTMAGKKAAAAGPAKVTMYGDTPMVVKKAGLFGLSRQNEMVVFLGLTLLAFIMVVHALIVQTLWYIILSVLLVPIALWKFIPAYKTWRGNRSFKRAWAESFGGGDDENAAS